MNRPNNLIQYLEIIHNNELGYETSLPVKLQDFADDVLNNVITLHGGIASRQIASVVYALYQAGILTDNE